MIHRCLISLFVTIFLSLQFPILRIEYPTMPSISRRHSSPAHLHLRPSLWSETFEWNTYDLCECDIERAFIALIRCCSICQMLVIFFWSWILNDCIVSLKKELGNSCLVFTSTTKDEIKQLVKKKCTKKSDVREKLCFVALNRAIVFFFLRFSLLSPLPLHNKLRLDSYPIS